MILTDATATHASKPDSYTHHTLCTLHDFALYSTGKTLHSEQMPSQILPQASADEQSITTLLNLLSQIIQTDLGTSLLTNRFETHVDAMKFLTHINQKLGNTKQDEHAAAKLPPALRNFSIIKEKATVAAALIAPAFLAAQKAIQSAPNDANNLTALETQVTQLIPIYTTAIQTRLTEVDLKITCRKVVVAGNEDFEGVYQNVWDMTNKSDEKGCEATKKAIAGIVLPKTSVKQTTRDPAVLLQHAASIQSTYKKTVLEIAATVDGVKTSIPLGLKKMGRIIEKTILKRKEDPGNADQVCDIVRGMVECTNMSQIAAIVNGFQACHDVQTVYSLNKLNLEEEKEALLSKNYIEQIEPKSSLQKEAYEKLNVIITDIIAKNVDNWSEEDCVLLTKSTKYFVALFDALTPKECQECVNEMEQGSTGELMEFAKDPDTAEEIKKFEKKAKEKIIQQKEKDANRVAAIEQLLEKFKVLISASTSGKTKLTVTRIKDRFFKSPSAGGWRDIMINFYLNSDSNKHICELQLVHTQMMTARKGLPGHAVYNRVRNASELLLLMGMIHEQPKNEKELQEWLIEYHCGKDWKKGDPKNGDIFTRGHPNLWDVSLITDMYKLFDYKKGLGDFNENISNWNVSNVTKMKSMFRNSETFNQPIDKWDVSNVLDMMGMFEESRAFNQPIDKWDVSKVTAMNNMFRESQVFNQPIDRWDVSKVTNMGAMFRGNKAFNQPIGEWDVLNVTEMKSMFAGSKAFKQILPDEWKKKASYTRMDPRDEKGLLLSAVAEPGMSNYTN